MYLKKRAFFISLVLTLTAAASVTVIMLQQHEITRTTLARYLNTIICESFDCDFTMRIESLRLLPLTLTCSAVSAKPRTAEKNPAWQWNARLITFRCSWLSLIFLRKLSTSITIDTLTAQSHVDQQGVAIVSHLKMLFFGKNRRIPLAIKALKIEQAQLVLENAEQAMQATISASLISKKIGPHLKSTTYITAGWCQRNKQVVANQLSGIINGTFNDREAQSAWISATLNLPQLPAASRVLHIGGQLTEHAIIGSINNPDQTLLLQGNIDLTTHDAAAHGSVHSSLITPFIDLPTALRQYHDTLSFTIAGNITTCSAQGTCALQTLPLQFIWQLSPTTGALNITNTRLIELPLGTKLPANAFDARVKHPTKDHYELTAAATVIDSKNGPTQGTLAIQLTHNNFELHGEMGQYRINARGVSAPHPSLSDCTIYSADNTLGTLKAHLASAELAFEGTIDYQHAHHLLPSRIGQHIPGSGILAFDGQATPRAVTLNLALHNGNIMLPQIHNTITRFQTTAQVDLISHVASLSNVVCQLQQGSIGSPIITCHSDNQLKPIFIHAPLSLNHCLINWNGSTLLISGNIIGTYQAQSTRVDGTVTIDKAHLDQDMVSNPTGNTPQNLFPASLPEPIFLSLRINTKKPIRIKTPELHSKVSLEVLLTGRLSGPQVKGNVTMHGGAITFPYCSLKIIRGALYVSPQHTLDPLIDLHARALVQQYTISAHLSGSAHHPTIQLESAPPLEEEQIASLLIAGSTNSLLNTAAAGLVVDNMAHYIADNLLKSSASSRILNALVKPLRHVRITPLFGQQAGLKTLGGALEIDLGKRLKAKLQKNLLLDEDPTLEVDYRLTDEVSVRAFKNEKGDVGSLLQMRLKF